MDLIDIGLNLSHDSFDRDREAVWQRAVAAGVTRAILTGASREHSPKALELARSKPGQWFATAGVHPHHASEYTAECDAELRALHAHAEVVAVGECGLDYFRDFSPRPAQRSAFEKQLQIAVDMQKPLFLHQRDAQTAIASAKSQKAKRRRKLEDPPRLSDDEKAAFYAKMVNADGFLPVSAINNSIRDLMLVRGLVTPERLRLRGVR